MVGRDRRARRRGRTPADIEGKLKNGARDGNRFTLTRYTYSATLTRKANEKAKATVIGLLLLDYTYSVHLLEKSTINYSLLFLLFLYSRRHSLAGERPR